MMLEERGIADEVSDLWTGDGRRGCPECQRNLFYSRTEPLFLQGEKREGRYSSQLPQLDPADLCRIHLPQLPKGGHRLCGEGGIKPTSANHSKKACPEGRALGVSGQNER